MNGCRRWDVKLSAPNCYCKILLKSGCLSRINETNIGISGDSTALVVELALSSAPSAAVLAPLTLCSVYAVRYGYRNDGSVDSPNNKSRGGKELGKQVVW